MNDNTYNYTNIDTEQIHADLAGLEPTVEHHPRICSCDTCWAIQEMTYELNARDEKDPPPTT